MHNNLQLNHESVQSNTNHNLISPWHFNVPAAILDAISCKSDALCCAARSVHKQQRVVWRHRLFVSNILCLSVSWLPSNTHATILFYCSQRSSLYVLIYMFICYAGASYFNFIDKHVFMKQSLSTTQNARVDIIYVKQLLSLEQHGGRGNERERDVLWKLRFHENFSFIFYNVAVTRKSWSCNRAYTYSTNKTIFRLRIA